MRTLLLTLTAAGACALAAVSADRLTDFRASSPVSIQLPASPDSAAHAEHPFDRTKLLSAMQKLTPLQAQAMMADYTTMVADTAGRLTLVSPDTENKLSMQRFATFFRPEGYMKGKLKIATPSAAKVFINGQEIISKSTFDSIPESSEGEFSLEPGRDAMVEVRTLTPYDSKNPTLAVEVIPDEKSEGVALAESAAGKTRFNIHTISEGPRLATTQLSPDGKFMLLTDTYSANSIDTDTTYKVVATPSCKVVAENLPDNAEWIQNADARLAFPTDNGDGTFNINTIDFPSQKRGILASRLPSEAMSCQLSPTADYIIYYNKIDGDADNTGVMHRIQSPDDRQPGNRDRYYLSIIRFADGLSLPLTYGGGSTTLCDISADGSKILYSSVKETPEEFPFYKTNLVQMNLATLATDTIRGVDASMQGAIFSPDAREVFILDGPNAFDGIGLNAGEFEWGNDFDVQGYIYNLDSKSVRAMTRDFNPSILASPVWCRGNGKIYLRGEDGFDANLFCLDPKSGKITKLDTKVDFTTRFSVAEKGNYLSYTGMSYTYMGRGYLLDLKSGKSELIEDPMRETLADIEFGEWDTWNFTAPDGTVIEGTITLPPDFSPEKRYPLIVYYYGGTSPSSHVNHHPYTPQLFASRGYVVYVLNPSGTTGYGQEFSARHVNAWGERTADEIIYGVKRFCEEHPFVDAEHIGCLGASYGGFMTQLLQTKTDIFAAAVSHAGISDITSYWGEGYWGYSYNSVAAARSYPWNNPKLFTEHSPLFNADKIHTPLLLLHGTVDTNVPIGESIQLYNALKILNREVEFITVEGANHVVIDFEKRKEWHATIMAWFEKWLKGDSRWWDSIYKK